MQKFITCLDWPNLIVGAILGGIVGLFLVRIIDWLRRIRLKCKGFTIESTNFGELYKLEFILKGGFDPGVCCCEILSEQGNSCAKWDETPNPLKGDKLDRFVPEMVPATYYQNLFLNKEYAVPILIKRNDDHFIFNAWWFGKAEGYYGLKPMKDKETITIIIRGNGFNWQKEFTVEKIKNSVTSN